MHKQQRNQERELAYRVVCRARRLLPLKPRNAYAHMRRSNHIYIICSITDSQSLRLRLCSSDHRDDISLLFGTDAARQHDGCSLEKLLKHLVQCRYLDQFDKALP